MTIQIWYHRADLIMKAEGGKLDSLMATRKLLKFGFILFMQVIFIYKSIIIIRCSYAMSWKTSHGPYFKARLIDRTWDLLLKGTLKNLLRYRLCISNYMRSWKYLQDSLQMAAQNRHITPFMCVIVRQMTIIVIISKLTFQFPFSIKTTNNKRVFWKIPNVQQFLVRHQISKTVWRL